jgi:hypothetical protein
VASLNQPQAVWLYGSVARGDPDAHSDIDVLVLSDGPALAPVRELVKRDSLAAQQLGCGSEVSIMQFTWKEVTQMASYGSLFLHHVNLEGRPLLTDDDGRSELLLRELAPYARGLDEMECFRAVLSDVKSSLDAEHSPVFELSVIATALRHAFILGCYVRGRPSFGRSAPFRQLTSELGRSSAFADELGRLYDFRLYQYGRTEVPFKPTSEDVAQWLEIANGLLSQIGSSVDDFYRSVP